MIRTRQALWGELRGLLAKLDGSADGARSVGNPEAGRAFDSACHELAQLLAKADNGDYTYAWAAASYPPDTVFTRVELAAALQCPVAAIERARIPASYVLGRQNPRFVWSVVSAFLRDSSVEPRLGPQSGKGRQTNGRAQPDG